MKSNFNPTQKQIQALDLLIQPFTYYLFFGGSRCFYGEQIVITKNGNKKISELKVNDYVLSYNNIEEYKKVIKVHKYDNDKKLIKVRLKNGGVIIGTEDHVINIENKWLTLKQIRDKIHGNI